MQDIADPKVHLKEGYAKIAYTCDQALADGLEYAWVDTCCIDKTSSAELSEAINSMYSWYSHAEKCYAYLGDVGVPWDTKAANDGRVRSTWEHSDVAFELPVALDAILWDSGKDETRDMVRSLNNSRWFTRGWTLQELIAPKDVIFFGKDWKYIGARNRSLLRVLSRKTGITQAVLQHRRPLAANSIAQRMAWAAHRKTSRREDEAYCLLGIFGVKMPLLYGEGEKAFRRLQHEIIRSTTDQSIFAWKENPSEVIEYDRYQGCSSCQLGTLNSIGRCSTCSTRDYLYYTPSLLATSTREFANCSNVVEYHQSGQSDPFELTSFGLSITLPLIETNSDNKRIGVLQCHENGECLGLWLNRRTTQLEPKRRDQGLFYLQPREDRLAKVDLEDVVKAQKVSILIEADTKVDVSQTMLRDSAPVLWFRLRNNSKLCHYRMEECWPLGKWSSGRETAFEYKPGSYMVAKFQSSDTCRIGGVVLADALSSRKFAICFRATKLLSERNLRWTELGDRPLRECYQDFHEDCLPQGSVHYGNAENLEATTNLDNIAEMRVVMKPEHLFGPFDMVIEVSISQLPGNDLSNSGVCSNGFLDVAMSTS